MSSLSPHGNAIGLIEAYDQFRSAYGDYTPAVFFFGVALGAMSPRINPEELIMAIEKLTATQEKKSSS